MSVSSNAYAKFLYFLVKSSGMAPFMLENNRVYSASWKHLILSIFYVGLCVPQFIERILNRSTLNFNDQTAMIQLSNAITTHVSNFSSALFPLTFLLKREKLVKILRALQKADDLLGDLGVEQNYEQYFRPRAISVGLTSLFIVIFTYGSALYWYISCGFSYYGSSYSSTVLLGPFTFLVSHHGVLLFANAIDFVRIRYEQLNGVLRNICSPERAANNLKQSGRSRRRFVRSSNVPLQENSEIYIETTLEIKQQRCQELRKIGKLCHHLHDLTEQLVDFFSPLILVSVAHYSMAFLSLCYRCFILAVSVYNTSDLEASYQLVNIFWWLFIVLIELFYIAMACSRIQRKAAGTALALHYMWLEHHPVELKNEVRDKLVEGFDLLANFFFIQSMLYLNILCTSSAVQRHGILIQLSFF